MAIDALPVMRFRIDERHVDSMGDTVGTAWRPVCWASNLFGVVSCYRGLLAVPANDNAETGGRPLRIIELRADGHEVGELSADRFESH